jgi:Fe-S cluster biogenesis protein NfuA
MTQIADQNPLGKIDALFQQSASLTDASARQLVEDTIAALMEMHGAGISRMLEKLSERDGGIEVIDAIADDPVVAGLLLIHNLHPRTIQQRVTAALDSVRPYLASHGGAVELLGITDEGAVHLRMQGSCHGCPSSAVTLKTSIEKAILEKAPDVAAIEVENLEQPPIHADGSNHDHNGHNGNGFVPLEKVRASAHRQALAIEGALL